MAKGLYRVYLYVVTILLLVFATVSVSMLLGTLLRLTALRGQNMAPQGSEVTQNVVLALVTLLIVAGLGGLHYWLIRRDMGSDPQPGASGVRSLLLNLALGIATMVAVSMGASALSMFNFSFNNDLSTPLAVALTTLALVIALEWERQRATPTQGAALVFQRLRIDGLGLTLLITVASFLQMAVSQTEQWIGQASGALRCGTISPVGPYFGPYYSPCIDSTLIGQWAAAALVIVVWMLYLRLGSSDTRTLIRPVFLLLGFTAGVIALVIGLERIVEFVLRVIPSTVSSRPDYINGFDVGPAFTFAAVALAVYGWRLHQGAQHPTLNLPTTHLTMRAIAGVVFAAPFWLGAQMLFNNLFTTWFPGPQTVAIVWYTSEATAIAGLAYIPLALWLDRGSHAEGIKGPRRGFVLALLAAGALATAGGAATLIYSVVTAILNVPLPDWQSVARQAGATLLVGLVLGGLYLWLAIQEGQFARAPKPEVAPEAPPMPEAAAIPAGGSLDSLLSQFQRGSLTQAEAAERIRKMARDGALV